LRTNLQFLNVGRPVQVLVVTSSMPEEGKSTTAINLAVAFSDFGRRVLLIEGDLRRPRIASYLGLEGAVGLTNVLAGEVGLVDVLQPWGRGGMTVIPSGTLPPNPSELLGSPAMSELVAHLRKSYDIIIIDAPPLLPVTDAAVASSLADGVVVVVRYAKTKRNQVAQSMRSLQAVEARVLGTVLNMAPSKGSQSYSSHGHHAQEPVRPVSLKERESLAVDALPAEGGKGLTPLPPAATSPRQRVGLRLPQEPRGDSERDVVPN
jgi:capsular exopolysaccharide synthesis family protein